MELSELTDYARETYQIEEQRKWDGFPGFSVLCHPRTGKWVALLMRQWDTDSGEEIQRCDLKCGIRTLAECRAPYLAPPIRMKGPKWISVAFGDETDPELVFRLFDRAIIAGDGQGYTLVLEQPPLPESGFYRDTPLPLPRQPAEQPSRSENGIHRDTPLPPPRHAEQLSWLESLIHQAASLPTSPQFAEQPPRPEEGFYRDTPLPVPPRQVREPEVLPERLREMKHLYEYGSNSPEARAANFLRQGRFMADYEDFADWNGMSVASYFPTYHDFTTRQLRGYFAWRARVRKGEYQPIAHSAAYVYLYELLNLIGTDSPEDALRRLKDFETGFVDAGYGNAEMRVSLHRWMTELAVIHALPEETARQYADPALLERDQMLAALQAPEEHTDTEVFSALCYFDGKRLAKTPVCRLPAERGERLFSRVWRLALKQSREDGKKQSDGCNEQSRENGQEWLAGSFEQNRENGQDLFTRCFGEKTASAWYPFANAVYCWEKKPADSDYQLDACRSYRCRDGVWKMLTWEGRFFDLELFHGLLRQTDAMLRRYLKTGNYLKEKPEEALISPCVRAVIEEEKKEAEEAARPRVVLDLSGLDQIRRDALITRDSLLTDEERAEEETGFSARTRAVAEATDPAWEKTEPAFPAEEKAEADARARAAVDEETAEPTQAKRETETAAPALTETADPAWAETKADTAAPAMTASEAEKENPVEAETERGDPARAEAETEKAFPAQVAAPAQSTLPELPLDDIQMEILRALLAGKPVSGLIREHHLMPALTADMINEAMYDEIGDSIVDCDNENLSLVEDYREDLTQLLGGDQP